MSRISSDHDCNSSDTQTRLGAVCRLCPARIMQGQRGWNNNISSLIDPLHRRHHAVVVVVSRYAASQRITGNNNTNNINSNNITPTLPSLLTPTRSHYVRSGQR
jgi:hypothetical protein